MKDPKNAKKMLNLAAKDFKALQNMADEVLFDVEIFGFHAQQTVEKLLKAWLSSLGIKYERTHDLQNLFSLLKDNNQLVPTSFEELDYLTDFAVNLRYDSFESLDASINRKELIEKVKELIGLVQKIVSG
jgi:HEPN domain-containing protein